MRYTDIKCPVCGIPFQTDDDIAVYPDCGALYHRHYYEREGRCLLSDTHNTGTCWTPPAEGFAAPERDSEIVYPVCGRSSPSDALFRSWCGSFPNQSGTASPPHQSQVSFRNDPPDYQNPYQDSGYQNLGGPIPPNAPFDPAQSNSSYQGAPNPFSPITTQADEPIKGDITAGETVKFIQNNSSYFLSVFFHKKRTNRGHFSFSAFLFSGKWMLYRKIYRTGTIITAWMTALFIISTSASLNYSSPLLMKLYEQARVSTSVYPSYEKLMKVAELVYLPNPSSIILLFTPLPTLLTQADIMMYCGFAGNRLYYRHCVEDIRKLKIEYPITAEYDKALQENGDVNVSLTLCLLICYSITIYLPNFFV